MTTSGDDQEANQNARLRIIAGVILAAFLAALDTTILLRRDLQFLPINSLCSEPMHDAQK